MNIELLRQVQEKIKAEPHLFQMPKLFQELDCGTACCIYGWGLAIKGVCESTEEYFAADSEPSYSDLFEVTKQQGESLVFALRWPEPFRSEFAEAEALGDKAAQAEIGSRRIDHLIQTGK